MLLRNRIILSLVVPVLAFLVGCGNGSKAIAPPTGGFSNSNLNGTYVFTSSGFDNLGGNFLTMAGTFAANGSGGITGGTIEIRSGDGTVTPTSITGGSYRVSPDGRGIVTLNANTGLSSATQLDFVLSTNSHGTATEFDSNGTGSGTIDLQSTVTQSQLANNTYVFNLVGTNLGNAPRATVGAITLDASGNATGTQDLNNNTSISSIAIGSGSNILLGSPATATLGALTFDVYPIDSTHLKFIETDSQGFLSGDVFQQTSATFPSGELAFTMGGFDYSLQAPLVVGGLMNSTGSAINNGLEDFNDAWNIDTDGTNLTPVSFAGTFNLTGGRYLVTLNGFENGEGGQLDSFTFAAYPSSGGLQMLEVDGGGVTGGAAFSQSSPTLASGQGYGLNLTASNIQGFEEDDIAEFTNTNNTLKGLIDVNDQGSTTGGQSLGSGTYTPDSANPGHGVISTNFFTLATYTVDANTTLCIEIDAGTQLGTGTIGTQAATSAQPAMAARMAAMRPRASTLSPEWKLRKK
jgi:hypothetical protein